MKKLITYCLSLVLLTSCNSKILDRFERVLDSFALLEKSSLTLVKNSTADGQEACVLGNRFVIERNYPANQVLYCKDLSKKSERLRVGETCPGGVSISEVEASSDPIDCREMTVCGMPITSYKATGKKTDNGTIDELIYLNLPWGCEAKIDYSFNKNFPPEETKSLEFYVQPSDCPFCARQNKKTCLPCIDLNDNEEIIHGRVIQKTCTGGDCKACPVPHRPEELIPHGEGKLFYKTSHAKCENKCANQSKMRVCNDGFWEGEPSYEFPECMDTACGCTLGDENITFKHTATKIVYKSKQPACGVGCASVSKVISCNDGTWETGDPSLPISPAELAQYPALSCSKKICHCDRKGRVTIADGQTRNVFQKNVVTCKESCSSFQGELTCNSGKLTGTNPAFLAYGFDSCSQEYCGCQVTLANNEKILINDGGSTTLYRYKENTRDILDACTNPDNRVSVSCIDKQLSPYDATKFKYKSCKQNNFSCKFKDKDNNETEVTHGRKLTVFKTKTPACGVNCESLELTCDTGNFTKIVNGAPEPVPPVELAMYKSTSCSKKNCDCAVEGFVIPFGSTIDDFYRVDKVTNCNAEGCQEAKASLTCTDKGLVSSKGDDPAQYKYRSCEFIPCGCKVPWGGTIEDGKSVKVFSKEKASCQDPDACTNSDNIRNVSCTNGSLTNYDENTFKFPFCKPAVCFCKWGDVEVPFGETLKVFKYEKAPDGQTCDQDSAEPLCQSGGTWVGANDSDYPYTQCVDLNDAGQGGGSGGGTGNDEGPGAGLKRRVGLGDGGGGGGGGPCLDVKSCRKDQISIRPLAHKKEYCILPWGGGEVEFYGSVAAFDTQCVTPPDRCSKHRIIRTCHFPKWTGEDSHRYPSCEEKAVCP